MAFFPTSKHSSYAFSFILALFLAGCSTTPEPEPEQEAALEAPEPPAAVPQITVTAPEPEMAPEIIPAAPKKYTVKSGDTLWDIASMFLRDPWFWPEIWHVNPQINNPHLIYPGDELTLYYVGGKPVLSITDGPRVNGGEASANSRPTVRLSPSVRVDTVVGNDGAAVPVQSIRAFMVEPRVVPASELDNAAHIVGSQDGRIIFATDDKVYVRGLVSPVTGRRYSIFRLGTPLMDPKNDDEIVGYEAIHVGEGTIINAGDPSTLYITRAVRESFRGDRLLPVEEEDNRTFYPHAPDEEVAGQIISLFDAISMVGQNQVAVINLGTVDGMEKGHVLEVLQKGRTIRDVVSRENETRKVVLPDERSGILMVFRTFEDVSYALIMNSTRPILTGDVVRVPKSRR